MIWIKSCKAAGASVEFTFRRADYMSWFRTHHRALLRIALVLWALAFGIAASHGCLSYPTHDPAIAHVEASASPHDQSHRLHASGCLQFCEDSSTAPPLSLGHMSLVQVSWILLLILPTLFLPAVIPTRFSALAVHLPAPPRPPARLSFVRFND